MEKTYKTFVASKNDFSRLFRKKQCAFYGPFSINIRRVRLLKNVPGFIELKNTEIDDMYTVKFSETVKFPRPSRNRIHDLSVAYMMSVQCTLEMRSLETYNLKPVTCSPHKSPTAQWL